MQRFLDALSIEYKPAASLLREIIVGASPLIREGIKWNNPSFRTTEWFATMNFRLLGKSSKPVPKSAEGSFRIVLHRGAKVRATPADGVKIDDPASLLEWLSADRAVVTFGSFADIESKQKELREVIQQWIVWV